MSPNAQHIALLTDMGWTQLSDAPDIGWGTVLRGVSPGDYRLTQPPDLTLDLMASVEDKLTQDECWTYQEHLTPFVHIAANRGAIPAAQRWSWHATKEQRREAYLKTRGLWVEEKAPLSA